MNQVQRCYNQQDNYAQEGQKLDTTGSYEVPSPDSIATNTEKVYTTYGRVDHQRSITPIVATTNSIVDYSNNGGASALSSNSSSSSNNETQFSMPHTSYGLPPITPNSAIFNPNHDYQMDLKLHMQGEMPQVSTPEIILKSSDFDNASASSSSLASLIYTEDKEKIPQFMECPSTSMYNSFHGDTQQLVQFPGGYQVKSELGSPPVSPINMEQQEAIKSERKRMRNRIAAHKCRRRKLERISKLEDKVAALKTHNHELTGNINVLKQQVTDLKSRVIDHVNQGCEIVIDHHQLVM